jgi:hypothetical protein
VCETRSRAHVRRDAAKVAIDQTFYSGVVQPPHRILVWPEQTRHFLVELTEVVVEQAQFFEREAQEPPMGLL